jgi:hypothetical protein
VRASRAGDAPTLSEVYILIGRVSWPTPFTKNVIRKSSKESNKQSTAELAIAGHKLGIKTN